MNFAKVGDSVPGICGCSAPPFPASGLIISGTPNFIEAGLPIAMNTGMVLFPCGTSTIIATGFNWIDVGLALARTGDQAVGCGTGTIIGSSQHINL